MEAVLEALPRTSRGKNEARRLRASGKIPAVLYGGEPAGGTPIAVDPKVLMRILHSDTGVNTLISLKTSATGQVRVLVREYQLDPVTSHLLHVDFYRVAMDKKLKVTVPIVVRGEAPGVKQQGGVLDFVHREVDVECLPADIPEHIEVDVSGLMVGQAVRVRDVAVNVKWTPVSESDLMLVHVIMPKIEEVAPAAEAAAAAAATPAEPEVIKKGKVEKPEEEE
ncbi:MAG TPA: 50S ribosomal protein L25 [Vicinamibacterales bacterium]|jgi:large subunit ribosomal protein L25